MKGPFGRRAFWENVLASVVAAAAVALAVAVVTGRLDTSSPGFGPIAGALVGLLTIGTALAVGRRRYVPFVAYMTEADLARRIASAEREIWSFQISGGAHTQNAGQLYERWIVANADRKLRLLFANPDNEALLESIVKLSGTGSHSSEESALAYLRATIRTSLSRYAALAVRYPGRVEVRIYDDSPPCSIHAVDAGGGSHASMFVETYLPKTDWPDRPCFLLERHHRHYALYARKSRSWFAGATPYHAPAGPAFDEEPPSPLLS